MRLILWIQHCFYGFYYVTEEDLKFFDRNLLAYLHKDTSSLHLLRVARWGLQIIKYFSHRHKLHCLEEGLQAIIIACFKIFLVIRKLHNTTPQKQHCMCSNSILNFSYNQRTVVIYHIRLFYLKSATPSCSTKLYSNKMPSQIFSPIKHCTSGILTLVLLLSTVTEVLHQLKSRNCTLCKKKRNQRNY